MRAAFWRADGPDVVCGLCPHACRIAPDKLGRCGVRRNRRGVLEAEAYGKISAEALDPVEKKPLYHVRPGSTVYSIGSWGCNFRCRFCQNWQISQRRPPLADLAPGEAAVRAADAGAAGVAYTYNEPLINFEYVLDCARQARAAGLLNVMVSNGYVSPQPLAELLPFMDAWNIDLKSVRPAFYRDLCGARLEPVQETIRAAAAAGHVELTCLLVTGANDGEAEIRDWVDWVAGVDSEIPVHFSRYTPQYQWEAPPTPPAVLARALAIARERLPWVYAGNWSDGRDGTLCPECGFELIPRQGYRAGPARVREGGCPRCGRPVPGLFEPASPGAGT